jgi:hypothetical protein
MDAPTRLLSSPFQFGLFLTKNKRYRVCGIHYRVFFSDARAHSDWILMTFLVRFTPYMCEPKGDLLDLPNRKG